MGMIKFVPSYLRHGGSRHLFGVSCLSLLQRNLMKFTYTKSLLLFPKNRYVVHTVVWERQFSDAISRDGQIHLIDENGKNAGLMNFSEAKLLAKEKSLELHLTRPVSHQHPHALFKLVSKKDIFEMKKKNKMQQHNMMKNRQKVKELSLSTDIGGQDFHWKLDRVREFLLENDKVKLIVNRKRRSNNDCDEFLEKVLEEIKDIGEIEGKIIKTEFRCQCILKPIS